MRTYARAGADRSARQAPARQARDRLSLGRPGRAVYLCCMVATRTQVYLTEEQRERIDRAAHARGVTMAEIIRSALNEYLEHDNDPSSALSATFGADPAVAPPSRDEWARG